MCTTIEQVHEQVHVRVHVRVARVSVCVCPHVSLVTAIELSRSGWCLLHA